MKQRIFDFIEIFADTNKPKIKKTYNLYQIKPDLGEINFDNFKLKKITTYRSRQKLPRSLVLVLSINKYYNPHCLVLD